MPRYRTRTRDAIVKHDRSVKPSPYNRHPELRLRQQMHNEGSPGRAVVVRRYRTRIRVAILKRDSLLSAICSRYRDFGFR